ncbi:MAG TPA: TonB-dependent receptor [Rhizomicrobium sp.]|nr:TonB-dependent receptor [Rhizomicrobium sp.]
MFGYRAIGWAAAIVAAASATSAQERVAANVETVTVVGTTPLSGTSLDADKLPESIETLDSRDLAREGIPSVTTALNNQLGSININDDLDDPFQPDVLYRGFEASPVLGTPEGLAVYQNGVRINESFGDAVNWDLVPDLAVARVDVISANPVYGLNALGGAIVIGMKNGFDYDKGELELSAGSWARRDAGVQFGANEGRFGLYAAGQLQTSEGWRLYSPDHVARIYGDASYRAGGLSLDLSLTFADNLLSGESPSPVQELAIDRRLIFTSPQSNRNRVVFPALSSSYTINDHLSLQMSVHYRGFREGIANGNTTAYAGCTSAPGFLCQPDGVTQLFSMSGAPIADISQDGTIPIGENDHERISTDSFGGTLQVTDTNAVLGSGNQVTAGATMDRDSTHFVSETELGAINTGLGVDASGIFVSTPENMPGNATPVVLDATNRYYGAFVTDTLDVTSRIAVTASGRYNQAVVALKDLEGTALTGTSRYSRLNSAIGATDALSDDVTLYVGYSEGNRAPTPGEIECANPLAPCLLPSSLSSDPPTLKQVVSHSWDLGLRGDFPFSDASRHLTWHADLFRTNVDDDIYGVATSLASGYFSNIGGTRRQGAEFGAHFDDDRFSGFLSYDFVDATFEASFLLPSPLNPGADANGNILVRPGDRLPGIPQHRLRLGADYKFTPEWSAGAVFVYEGSRYYRGDESNQMKPMAGFAALNLHSTYELEEHAELFFDVFNLLDARYATLGVLGDPTGIGAPGIPTGASGVDYRFESPAAPRSVLGGVRLRL